MNNGEEAVRNVTAPARQPVSLRTASVVLLFQFIFPALVRVLTLLVETPTGDAIDWAGKSLPARALDALFLAHLTYAAIAVALLRGWRGGALAISLAALVVAALVNFDAHFAVTGVYF